MLANYISSIDNFHVECTQIMTYGHMGATITDTVLQSGLNYKTVVEPRVKKILRIYPSQRTTSEFLEILETKGSSQVLDWSPSEKTDRVLKLTMFFSENGVEAEDQLKNWIADSKNCKILMKIKGIGPKTIDYLKKLVGISAIAVDRHIRKFVHNAGLDAEDYDYIRSVVEFAADLLVIPRSCLDKAIWNHSTNNLM